MTTARFALRVLWRALAVPAGLVQLWLSLRYAGFALELCESPAADPVTLSLALLVASAVSLRYAVRGES